jgi:hypothetical protein
MTSPPDSVADRPAERSFRFAYTFDESQYQMKVPDFPDPFGGNDLFLKIGIN